MPIKEWARGFFCWNLATGGWRLASWPLHPGPPKFRRPHSHPFITLCAKLPGVTSSPSLPARLTRLEIRHLATIDALELDLPGGFVAFTGETGAGKSIIVDALGLLLGGRSNGDLIRSGEAELLVTAFWDEDSASRRLTSAGRSTARLDGEVVSLRELGEAVGQKLTIHWQHSAQSLLSAANQRALLDGQLGEVVGHYSAAYRQWVAARERLERLQSEQQTRERTLDLLRFQVKELAEAALQEGEEEPLRQELSRLSNVEAIAQGAGAALELLSEGEVAATGLIAEAIRALNAPARYDEAAEQLQGDLIAALESVQAVAGELQSLAEDRAPDPEELARVDERLSLISKLQGKYGATVEEVLRFQARAEEELYALENDEQDAGNLAQEVTALEQAAHAQALLLRAERQKVAPPLAEKLLSVIRELGMPHARLEFELRPADKMGAEKLGPHGLDDPRMLFSANPGEALSDLALSASGGELSRVMLAISTVLGASTPSVVFDEVDAGIGGAAALAVAAQLSSLARGKQVLVVTHLAQIAAAAHWHYKVEKEVVEGRTVSRVRLLDDTERLHEIARMLSGNTSQAALGHARELLSAQPAASGEAIDTASHSAKSKKKR